MAIAIEMLNPAPARAVVLVGDELPIPPQDRVGRQQAGDVAQQASAECLAANRQASSLLVAEPQPPTRNLFAQDPILLFQIVDDGELAPIDPAGEQEEQELKRAAFHGATA